VLSPRRKSIGLLSPLSFPPQQRNIYQGSKVSYLSAEKCSRQVRDLSCQIVLTWFELRYLQSYGKDIDRNTSAIVGKFTYTHREFWNELLVDQEYFRWSHSGCLISSPLKTEEEWLDFIRDL
jgi:hypothetical protein